MSFTAGLSARARPGDGYGRGMTDIVYDDLWEEFHTVVNMTSRELEDWLRESEALLDTEPLPDQAGAPTGRAVLAVLGKRRGHVTRPTPA
jgi:hypothetical protein